MSPTNAAVLTGVVVTVGRWSEGKPLSAKVVVGAAFLAIFLSVMPEDLGQGFAVLILLGAVLKYSVTIAQKAGLTK
jgi:hypothetical protein